MYSRHTEVPVYEIRDGVIKASHYNRVQLAMIRLKDDLRIHLAGLRNLDLIMQKDAWIVVDNSLNDLPVIAWTDFVHASRDALHADMPCRIRLYHQHAQMLLEQVLEVMDRLLGRKLNVPGEGAKILPFSPAEGET